MNGLTNFEQMVLDKQLAGDHPVLVILRTQAKTGRVVARKNTGVGFFCDFAIDPAEPVTVGDFQISDVHGELSGLKHGAGFVLFIRSGRLSMLEGFTFDEPWPVQITDFELKYDRESRQLSLPDA